MKEKDKNKRKTKIQAIGYIRQSDEREDKEDISEQTQLSKIKQFCDYHDLELVAVFKDIDYSGFRISYTKRPGLMDGLAYLKTNKKVKKLICYNLSRLTRRKKDFSLIHESLEGLGVDICSALEQLDFGSANGRLFASMLADFNEYYSDNLSEITNSNKQTNAEKGRWNGGPFPFGIVKHGKGSIEDQNGTYIKTMFEMAKSGNGPFKIAKWAVDNNIPTETGVQWTPRRVRYVLTNVTYARMQKWKGKVYPLLPDYAMLVTWEDFLYIQSTLFGEEKAWKGKERQMLTSVMRCPVCGKKMFSRTTRYKNNRRYVCCGKNEPGSCKSPNFDLATLDVAVIELIAKISTERYSKSEIWSNVIDDDNISSIQNIRYELERLDKAKQKIFDDYYVNQRLSEDDFEAAMSRFEKRQSELAKQLEKIPMPNNKFGDFDDILSELGTAILSMEKDDKRKIVELIITEIVPGESTVVQFRWGESFEIKAKEKKKHFCDVYFY